jgi:hypothetical protein
MINVWDFDDKKLYVFGGKESGGTENVPMLPLCSLH